MDKCYAVRVVNGEKDTVRLFWFKILRLKEVKNSLLLPEMENVRGERIVIEGITFFSESAVNMVIGNCLAMKWILL